MTSIREIRLKDDQAELVKVDSRTAITCKTHESKQRTLICSQLIEISQVYSLPIIDSEKSLKPMGHFVLRYFGDLKLEDLKKAFDQAAIGKVNIDFNHYSKRGMANDLLSRVLKPYAIGVRALRKSQKVESGENIRSATREEVARSFSERLAKLTRDYKEGKNIDGSLMKYLFEYLRKHGASWTPEHLAVAKEHAQMIVADEFREQKESREISSFQFNRLMKQLDGQGSSRIEVEMKRQLLKIWIEGNDKSAEELLEMFMRAELNPMS